MSGCCLSLYIHFSFCSDYFQIGDFFYLHSFILIACTQAIIKYIHWNDIIMKTNSSNFLWLGPINYKCVLDKTKQKKYICESSNIDEKSIHWNGHACHPLDMDIRFLTKKWKMFVLSNGCCNTIARLKLITRTIFFSFWLKIIQSKPQNDSNRLNSSSNLYPI